MDYIATLYLVYMYLKYSESQSVGARVEKKIVMLYRWQHLLAASSRAICLVEQIYGHREFFPANLLMLPLVLQKQNWGSTYHMIQMAAEGICHNSFFGMNYLNYWCMLRSDNSSGSNNWSEFCKEYIYIRYNVAASPKYFKSNVRLCLITCTSS